VEPVTNAYFETGYAKINLALHIRVRRDDGYHELDTIFAFVDDGDHLFAEIADSLSLNISGPFGEGLSAGADNLVLQAGRLLQTHFKIDQGAKLHLIKRLPIASGIGGGSADAAAAARLLNQLWGIGRVACAVGRGCSGLHFQRHAIWQRHWHIIIADQR
jgi:4-diphosphocytidyl-2-C-methyl-D-erythritol kinase